VRESQSFTAGNVVSKAAAELSPIPVVPADRPTPGITPLRVLILDEDDALRQMSREAAIRQGFTVCDAASISEARNRLQQSAIDVALLDIGLPGDAALRLVSEIASHYPRTEVVVMTGFATAAIAMEAMRSGAGDYLAKPFTEDELLLRLERASQRIKRDFESRRLREQLRTDRGMGSLIGTSAGMEKLYRILSKVALSRHPALILGEGGSGKEAVARAIHSFGPHTGKPFAICECAGVPDATIEAKLFGQGKGTARSSGGKTGVLVAAGSGTVFLDEVSELSLAVQGRLVRALQEKQVQPLGDSQPVPFAARVLAASSRNIMALLEQGQFRKDLYFRLSVVKLVIPPLRERRQDIPALAQSFLEHDQTEQIHSPVFSDEALRLLCAYDWPGNVRELQHAVARTVAVSSGPVLHTVDLPTQLQDFHQHLRAEVAFAAAAHDEQTADEMRSVVSISDMEKQAILGTIRQLNGDKLMAARLLGIGKTTLYRKLKEYGEQA
jgi:DNA-binding NtrC family response regulator